MADNDFILKDEIFRFAHHLACDINSPKRRKEVEQEYAEHLEDAIYYHTLRGMTEEQAFRLACEEMGNTAHIQTLLATVHNKDKMPRRFKIPIIFALILSLLSTYFISDNMYFRTWYFFIAEVIAIIAICIGAYYLWLFVRATAIRIQSVKKLKKYARRNGHKLIVKNPYLSLFKKTSDPEIIYETETQRYIMSLWSTVKRKQTLHLTDFGFYSYSNNIGYFLIVRIHGNIGAALNLQARLPKDVRWWHWYHHEIIEDKPDDVRFMPRIEFEAHAHPDKENIFALLLNPIPLKIDYVEKGVLHKGGDDAKFDGVVMWSVSGFMSYMDGRMLYEKKKFKSKFFD